ncbi:DUF3313 family protein [Marinicella sp. W31]|uniref:DUF3313 family protein n=1 Tax=Marinicella sp. W31 TaxID=3023713 RepID=UPI0037583A30
MMTSKALPIQIILIMLCFVSSVYAKKTPKIQTGPSAEISYDGLHKVDHTVMDDVWAKPDIDLSQYKKILIANTQVAFKDVKENSRRLYRRLNNSNEFSITERNKKRITQEIQITFKNELSKVETFQISETPGDDVLLIEASIIDIVSHIPPEDYSSTDVYVRSAGEATLILEFKDSISKEILIRAVDQRAAQDYGFLQKTSAITDIIEFKRLANNWARTLRKRLDEISKMNDT